MAQPVFDGHPLEEYLQDSGEATELMPGGTADFSLQLYLKGHSSSFKHSKRMEKLCFLIFNAVQSLSSLFSNCGSLRTQAFAERFKYGVITSSLLSPAFTATPMVESHRRGISTPLPGRLSNSHSRTPSAAESMLTDTFSLSMPTEPETPMWPVTLSLTVVVAALSARFYFFALLLLACTLYYIRVHRLDSHSKPDVMTPSLQALQHLISAGQLWDTVINDTFTILENEERSIFYGPTTPLTPSSSLRVALSTSLLTTQTQCDNVRQLLSAITSPSELAQLAEMYAPPSPIKSTFTRSGDSRRPLSHPGPSPRDTPLTDRMKKRSTWNGSYISLALAGSPPVFQLAQRREKRRSDLGVLIGATSPSPARIRSRNAVSSPPQLLADVSEEEDGMVTAASSLEDEDESSFGTAALGLYRNRLSGGLRALELSHRSMPLSPTRRSSTKRRTTMSPGSKYTSMNTTRHPFSLSSLSQSLQSALASKRFACSHLLALRFEDDEDEVYWEDVHAVMGLLTSTLVDASSRLSEVLDEIEEQHLKADNDQTDARPSGLDTPSSQASPPRPRARLPLSQAIEHVVSFAPTPSHLTRFAAHVGAISSALDDAREQLELCVASLKEERTMPSPGHSSHPSTSSSDAPAGVGAPASTGPANTNAVAGTFGEASEHPSIQAYERLRRELGLALRECERGRVPLVHIVVPPSPSTEEDLAIAEESECKGEEKVDDEVSVEVVSPSVAHIPLEPDPPHPRSALDKEGDDATAHLLLSTSAAHLPPPGVEQVFEANSETTGFARARSILSREERIRLARAKRAHGRAGLGNPGAMDRRITHDPFAPSTSPGQLRDLFTVSSTLSSQSSPPPFSPPLSPPVSPPPPLGASRELWGPTDDVVSELKDVIYKVGQRRRPAPTSTPVSMPTSTLGPTLPSTPTPMPTSMSATTTAPTVMVANMPANSPANMTMRELKTVLSSLPTVSHADVVVGVVPQLHADVS